MTHPLAVPLEEVFDLAQFDSKDFRGDDYERVSAASDYLEKACLRLDPENLARAVNPVKLRCIKIQGPDINSHGELELWVADPTKFGSALTPRISARSLDSLPRGLIPCIDTQKILSKEALRKHNMLFFRSAQMYGNVRRARDAERYIPGNAAHFIEIGAISYSDVGNTWISGVCGKNFNRYAEATK